MRIYSRSSLLPQIPHHVLPAFVPEHSLAKDQSERHLVDQRLQCARRSPGPGKICVRPPPEAAMPVSTVVPLHAEAQRISGKLPAIERDLSGEERIRMRRSGKPDPALVAQGDSK